MEHNQERGMESPITAESMERDPGQAAYTAAFELAAKARETLDNALANLRKCFNPQAIAAVLALVAGGEAMAGGNQVALEQGVLGTKQANVLATGKLGGPTVVEANILDAKAQQATGLAKDARAANQYRLNSQVPLSPGTVVPTTGAGGGFLIR